MRPRCARRINPFTRLPDSPCCQPGLERQILRRIPMALPVGAAVILAPSAILRLGSWDMHPQEMAAIVSKVDMLALGVLLLYWNLMVALTWGAFIVMVMKGPTYVADSYPLIDEDSPADAPLPLGELEAWHCGPEAFTYPGPNVAPFARNWRWRAHHTPRRHAHPGRGAARYRPIAPAWLEKA
jgi:hypothetical protein